MKCHSGGDRQMISDTFVVMCETIGIIKKVEPACALQQVVRRVGWQFFQLSRDF